MGVGDPARKNVREITFLADSGAYYVTVPPSLASELGLTVLGRAKLTLADKRVVEAELAPIYVRALDREAYAWAAIIDVPDPLLGVEALEALGLMADPATGELKHSRPYGLFLFSASES